MGDLTSCDFKALTDGIIHSFFAPAFWASSPFTAVGIKVKPGIMSSDGSLPSDYGRFTLA